MLNRNHNATFLLLLSCFSNINFSDQPETRLYLGSKVGWLFIMYVGLNLILIYLMRMITFCSELKQLLNHLQIFPY